MKRFLCLILASLFVLGCVPASAYSMIDARIDVNVGTWHDFYKDVESRDVESSKGIVIGQYLKTGMQVKGVALYGVSYADSVGNLTVSVYKWAGSYDATVSKKPHTVKTFVDFADCSWLEMTLDGEGIYDEILVVADQYTDRVGLYTYASDTPENVMFLDGQPESGRIAGIRVMTEKEPISLESVADKAVDAYTPIDLSQYVDMYNMEVRTHGNDEGKPSGVNAVTDNAGAYAAYVVDFGKESPKGAVLKAKNVSADSARIQVIADDIKTGKILCEFDSETTGVTFWDEISAKITEEITGVHLIYFVAKYNGFYPVRLTFTHDVPAPTKYEQRIIDFEATKDFEITDSYSDTWTATDMLGRKLADNREVGDYNPDKQVGMFYWTWHTYDGSGRGINQRIINRYQGDEADIKNNFNYKGWRQMAVWNESIYGLYTTRDKWVMRKQLELLESAGVDSLFFDSTNGTNTYTSAVMNLAEVMHEMHLDGVDTPKFAFMLPFHDKQFNLIDLERVYENIYSKGLFSDSWYYWEGKPVIMGYPDNLSIETASEDVNKQHKDILDFFTFRPGQPAYKTGPKRADQWPWLEAYPQHAYGTSDKYGCETVAVGIAQNTSDEVPGSTPMNGEWIYGRSYTYKDKHTKLSDTSKYYGYNFAEQWERVFELDPEFVFITGWNEWKVVQQSQSGSVANAFYDAYNDEYSRDIEPTTGEMKDVYYYQTANFIRKFKGVRPTPEASSEKTININGGFAQWSDVGPDFVGYKSSYEPRNETDQSGVVLTNNTLRNDIVLSKVARDSENLYFYVKTAKDISPYTDPAWMRLLINTDRTYKTGWEGYDFVVNNVSPTAQTATVSKWTGTDNVEHWRWEKAADVMYKVQGNEMMISIPRSVLGVTGNVDFEFKWIDNMQNDGYIMDVYNNGDSAPVGRFAYHYTENAAAAKKAAEEPVDPATFMEHTSRKLLVMALDRNWAYAYGKRCKIDDKSDVTAPMIINDKTMVPVRFIAEQLGAAVEWIDETKTVRIIAEKRIQLTLNSNVMQVEKEKYTLQSPATEVENRIYVPLRDIVEALGMGCHWVEPGIICIGSDENYGMFYVNGGIDKLMDLYNIK